MMKKKLLAILVVALFVFITSGISFASTFNNVTYPSITFTDLNTKLIGSNVFSTGFEENATFNITNNTGQTWTDFHLGVGSPNPPFHARFAIKIPGINDNWDGDVYEGPGNETLPHVDEMDIVGLSIANNAVFSFSVDILSGEGGWIMVGHPTIGGGSSTPPGPSVPEPSTIFLVGLGLLGIAGIKKARKKS